jgi:hypothetical protein
MKPNRTRLRFFFLNGKCTKTNLFCIVFLKTFLYSSDSLNVKTIPLFEIIGGEYAATILSSELSTNQLSNIHPSPAKPSLKRPIDELEPIDKEDEDDLEIVSFSGKRTKLECNSE